MTDFILQLQPFSQWLLRSTFQVSLLICLILVVKAILGKKLAARWHYWLWLLIVVRMVLPIVPATNFSMFNFLPGSDNQSQQIAATPILPQQIAAPAGSNFSAEPVGTVAVPLEQPVVAKFQLTGPQILLFVYLAGVVALAVYLLAGCFHFWKTVKANRPVTSQNVLDILEDCKTRMGVRTIVAVVETSRVKSPVLFGFVRPRLLLPVGLIDKLRAEELSHIFCHELAHIKRCDIAINWVVAALQALHWFNPLVWYAFYRMRADRELACDSLVLSVMDSQEQPHYGRTIIRLIEMFSQTQMLPAMAGILETKSNLKKRITMIAKFKKGSYRFSILAIILLTAIGCVALTDEKVDTENIVADTEPTVSEKGPADKSDFTATLPNGVKVELIGVCEYPSKGKQWWRPDGEPLGYDILTSDASNYSSEYPGYEIAFKIYGRDYNFIRGRIKGSKESSNLDIIKPKGISAHRVHIKPGITKTKVEAAVAAGKWKTIASHNGHGTTFKNVKSGKIIFSAANESKGGLVVTVSGDADFKSAIRLVAIDKSGVEHNGHIQTSISVNDMQQQTFAFANMLLENVKEFAFQTRPYQRVEFKNISLKPGQKTNVEVKVKKPKTSAKVDISPANFDIRLNPGRGVHNLVVSIHNQSDVTIPQFKLRFYRGDIAANLDEAGNRHSGWHGAGPIEPGKSWNESTRPFHLPDGKYKFGVVLDYDNKISETDENNNTKILQIEISNGKIKTASDAIVAADAIDKNFQGLITPREHDIKIVSINPETSEILHIGQSYDIEVEVEYSLEADEGTITLVIQRGELGHMPIANLTEPISKGEGKLTLKTHFTVPETNLIQIFTPLMAQGATATSVVSTRTYEVTDNRR